jgi:hypothetical protein
MSSAARDGISHNSVMYPARINKEIQRIIGLGPLSNRA